MATAAERRFTRHEQFAELICPLIGEFFRSWASTSLSRLSALLSAKKGRTCSGAVKDQLHPGGLFARPKMNSSMKFFRGIGAPAFAAGNAKAMECVSRLAL